MNEQTRLSRSPDLMSAHDTALLVVDVQEKLMPLIPLGQRIVWNIRRLIDGGKLLGLKVLASEQYPQGLGPTVPELASRLGKLATKTEFSCAACDELFAQLDQHSIPKLLIAGIEAHVCVQQTVLDALAAGYRVYLAVDAVGSRFDVDRETSLRRMESAGATLTTTEAALFEWCQTSARPEFKQISSLVREKAPE